MEPTIPAIGIDRRDEIEDTVVEQVVDLVEAPVLVAQVPSRISDSSAALHFVAVSISIDVHPRLAFGIAGGAGDFQTPKVAALDRFPHGIKFGQLGESGVNSSQDRSESGGVIKAVPFHVDFSLRRAAQRRK